MQKIRVLKKGQTRMWPSTNGKTNLDHGKSVLETAIDLLHETNHLSNLFPPTYPKMTFKFLKLKTDILLMFDDDDW